MPRPYVLADIIDTFNTEIGTALSPDVSDTQQEQVNQFASLIDTMTGGDVASAVATTAASVTWANAQVGNFQWA